YWLSCGRYIERNPVAAGLVAVPWDYPWSSSRAYALGEPDPLLTEDPCYTELSPDPERRRQLWRGVLCGRGPPRRGAGRRAAWGGLGGGRRGLPGASSAGAGSPPAAAAGAPSQVGRRRPGAFLTEVA